MKRVSLILVALLTVAVGVYGALLLFPDQAASLVADDPKVETNAVLTPVLDKQDYTPKKAEIDLFPPFTEPGHPVGSGANHPIPPIFPADAERSGRCVYTAGIDRFGKVNSILSMNCSDYVFEQPSRMSIMKTRFYPAENENGQAIPSEYGPRTIRFQLLDEEGNIIPE